MGVKVTGDAELLANLNKLQFGVAKKLERLSEMAHKSLPTS